MAGKLPDGKLGQPQLPLSLNPDPQAQTLNPQPEPRNPEPCALNGRQSPRRKAASRARRISKGPRHADRWAYDGGTRRPRRQRGALRPSEAALPGVVRRHSCLGLAGEGDDARDAAPRAPGPLPAARCTRNSRQPPTSDMLCCLQRSQLALCLCTAGQNPLPG